MASLRLRRSETASRSFRIRLARRGPGSDWGGTSRIRVGSRRTRGRLAAGQGQIRLARRGSGSDKAGTSLLPLHSPSLPLILF
eukprot:1109914-Rhodomonas_salina.1